MTGSQALCGPPVSYREGGSRERQVPREHPPCLSPEIFMESEGTRLSFPQLLYSHSGCRPPSHFMHCPPVSCQVSVFVIKKVSCKENMKHIFPFLPIGPTLVFSKDSSANHSKNPRSPWDPSTDEAAMGLISAPLCRLQGDVRVHRVGGGGSLSSASPWELCIQQKCPGK